MEEATIEQIEHVRRILRKRNLGLIMMFLYVPSIYIIYKLTNSDFIGQTSAIIYLISLSIYLIHISLF